ncbi:chorismate mutase [Microvirga tunisiensis]|uniref:chorismate mutase n=1 Tax=Pannonibacter tanglangensis TaxID=2750084 RepID=A0ABW9ZHP4_9HYPH|nr:chorismate mutase [Pannonibacter sp. XCT-34]NBN64385.1 chorismate mutase [Pannonibacter sp. XCT-34]
MRVAADCTEKAHIRNEIDRLDRALVALFAERQTYVRRMAEIKQHPDEAYDQHRIDTMLADIRARAAALGLEPEQAETVWRVLIDWNVAYEQRTISARTGLSLTPPQD